MSKQQITYKQQIIEFELTRKPVKNINLRVHADLRVAVSASHKVPLAEILAFVESKGEWILTHLQRFKQEQQSKAELSAKTRASLLHLGSNLTIDVQQSKQAQVKQQGERILLTVPDKEDQELKLSLISQWQQQQAQVIFPRAVQAACDLLWSYKLPFPKLTIRKMKSRWGSCSPSRQRISLNLYLIQTPPKCINYVALHEMTHFIHPNHSRAFYDCLSSVMPEWQKYRAMLKELAFLTRQ